MRRRLGPLKRGLMFDRHLRPLIDPPLNHLASLAHGAGLSANAITLAGFAMGLLSVPALAHQSYGIALLLILLNRVCDGLDGALARLAGGGTDFGGYLDIVTDMMFYGAVVFGFALAAPGPNALPATFLLTGFMGASASFLAFSALAAKRDMSTEAQGVKSIYYLSGLMEGGETVFFFVIMCLIPGIFPWLAWAFGGLCWVTALARSVQARQLLR